MSTSLGAKIIQWEELFEFGVSLKHRWFRDNVKKFFSADNADATPVAVPEEVAPIKTEVEVQPEVEAPVEKKEEPKVRVVIQAPVLIDSPSENDDNSQIKIKAQPSKMGDECRFMLNREVFKDYSWFFPHAESAKESLLAETLFAADDDVETVLFHDTTFTITRKNKTEKNWESLAKTLGAAARQHLEKGLTNISSSIVDDIPEETIIREQIQEVMDNTINPGVAGHNGNITLVKLVGNTATINMGGGCQGCSSAALTLKSGIETNLRDGAPQIGAILDTTDHAAGQNPYYS